MEIGRSLRHRFSNADCDPDAGSYGNANADSDTEAIGNPDAKRDPDTCSFRYSRSQRLESGSGLQSR